VGLAVRAAAMAVIAGAGVMLVVVVTVAAAASAAGPTVEEAVVVEGATVAVRARRTRDPAGRKNLHQTHRTRGCALVNSNHILQCVH
jgi:hypothetical protein